ncbi:hypothetical protein C8R45DRAFT_1174559 [Mycena sanguinolenta]|nr:hypothetical protein C8R45DRAFT_1174559 [Mycena sanguinolenta]
MDIQPHSDSECSVVSTTNSATAHPEVVSPQPSGFISNVFMKSMNVLPSLFGGPRVSSELAEPTGNRTRNDLETRAGFTTTDHLVTNNYYISASGGVGGAGGVGCGQGIGGGGGVGHEFRTTRLGDIKLKKEIRPYHYGVVDFQSPLIRGAVVRRVYSGEIRGDPRPVTVVIYERDRAEEEWRQDLPKYAAIR